MAHTGLCYLALVALFAVVFAHSSEGNHGDHSKSLHGSSACTRKYTIMEGDTCDKISATHRVSTHQLAHVNKKINDGCTNLVIGDTLCLGLNGQDCTKVEVVKENDICFAVAKRAGIPLDVLFKNNPNINKGCTNIYPGEVLCVSPTINSTVSSITGIKGPSHPPKFPYVHSGGNTSNGSTSFNLPPINLTESGGDLLNLTNTPLNASSISSSFPSFNLTNSSFPGSDSPSISLPPPFHFNRTRIGPSRPFNLTDSGSRKNSDTTTGTSSAADVDSNLNPDVPLFGEMSLPPFPTVGASDTLDSFEATTTTTTSTTTTLGLSPGSSASVDKGVFGGALPDSSFPFPTIASGDFNTPPIPF